MGILVLLLWGTALPTFALQGGDGDFTSDAYDNYQGSNGSAAPVISFYDDPSMQGPGGRAAYGESGFIGVIGSTPVWFVSLNTTILGALEKIMGRPYAQGYAYFTFAHEMVHVLCGHHDDEGQEEPAKTCDEIAADLAAYALTCKRANEKCEKLATEELTEEEREDCEKELEGLCDALEQAEDNLNGNPPEMETPAEHDAAMCYEAATSIPPTWSPNRGGGANCPASVPPAPTGTGGPDSPLYPNGLVAPCPSCEEGACDAQGD